MNTRSLTILAGTTVFVAALAAITLRHGESAVRGTEPAGKVFPALADSINDVTTIELKRKDGTTTLVRTDGGWGLAEKGGYPIDVAAVRKTLIGSTELTAAEARTDDAKMYPKLGVEDPGTEGGSSTLLTLRDASGKDLASLIVGKEHTGKSFNGPRQVYVRKPGEARSWLATGELDLKEKGTDWLDKKILEVKRDRIRAVEIRHADGELVQVDREKPDAKDFTLHDVPEGKELTFPSAPASVADALGYLNLEDVLPASELDVATGAAGTATFTCFDGLTITVTTKDVGDKTYARFEASYEKPPEPSGPTPPPAEPPAEPAKDPADAGEDEHGHPADAAEKPETKSPEAVQKEVADLNAKLSKWVYQIPSYNKASLQKKKSELLKDKTPPPEVAPPSAPGSEGAPPAPADPPKAEPPEAETPRTDPPKPPQPPRFGG